MSCPICISEYSGRRYKIDCMFCKAETCVTCCQTYVLSEPDPTCMHCRRLWPRSFLQTVFTGVFLKKLQTHREDVLFEREKALLPTTLPLIEKINRMKELDTLIAANKQKIRDLHHEQAQLENERRVLYRDRYNLEPVTQAQVHIPCFRTECRGYYDAHYKCRVCHQSACAHCHAILTEKEHVCDPVELQSVSLLKKETKACPTCTTLIYKISGCDQMWCTQCNTGFDWRTQRVFQPNATIHNPHYFEWLAQGGTRPAPAPDAPDAPCGNRTFVTMIDRMLRQVRPRYGLPVYTPEFTDIIELIRRLLHIEEEVLPVYRQDVFGSQELRIKYMTNEYSEQKMRMMLRRQEKRNEKNRDQFEVFQFVIEAAKDIIERFVQTIQNGTTYNLEILQELENVRTHANESFKNIGSLYKNTPLYISPLFIMRVGIADTDAHDTHTPHTS
jgi:hypothetical protein